MKNSLSCFCFLFVLLLPNFSGAQAPNTTIAVSQRCGSTVVTRQSNPPVGVVWYWQTSAEGTSDAHGFSASITLTQTTGLYLRACTIRPPIINWGPAQSFGTITVSGAPQAPTVANNSGRFGLGSVTISTAVVSGATSYAWYQNGMVIPGATANSYTVPNLTSTSVYEVASVNSCGTSGRLSVTATFATLPFVVALGQSYLGEQVLLGVNSIFSTYTWRNQDNVIVGTAATLSVTQPGRYRVSVTKLGIQGSAVSPEFEVVRAGNTNRNFVELTIVNKPLVSSYASVDSLSMNNKQKSILYVDGLGRDLQTVSEQASPMKYDIVTPFAFDEYGRQAKTYLPFIDGNDGLYKEEAISAALPLSTDVERYEASKQYLFYQNGTGLVPRDSQPYSESVFERGALNSVLKTGAAGNDWQPDTNHSYASLDHTIKTEQEANAAGEILNLKYIYSNVVMPIGSVRIGNPAYFLPNALQKNKIKDEDGNETFEYIDESGKTILKRVKLAEGLNADTYYVYDDFGSLGAVVPPEAVKNLLNVLSVRWLSAVGVSIGSAPLYNVLTKTAATGYGNSGAYINSLQANEDGWIEATALEENTSRMIGLASSNVNAGSNIQYALEFSNDGVVYAWENGVRAAAVGQYSPGAVIRVSREGTQVKYYLNGKYQRTSPVASSGILIGDVALNEKGATLTGITAYFGVNASLDVLLKNFGYIYSYDSKKRMIRKKLPGVEPTYMVYDNRDRLVLTQDGNQRTGNYWSFTKYDELNRPVLSGIKDTTTSLSQEVMQGIVDAHYAKPWARYGESFVGYSDDNIHGYTNKAYPVCTSGTLFDANHYLTVTYYDRYDFRKGWYGGNYVYQNTGLVGRVAADTYTYPTSASPRVLGQVTGMKVKVLDDGIRGGCVWLKSVNYYDDKQRLVQEITDNLKGGIDRRSILYDFVGKVLKTQAKHTTFDVSWKDMLGTRIKGNTLYRSITNNSWGQSGAASVEILPAGQDGWVEFTATEADRSRMLGLSEQNLDADHTSLGYAFYLRNDGALVIREGGSEKKILTERYNPGDGLRIARVGTAVKYYLNGREVYPAGGNISQVASTTQLLVDVSFATSGGSLANVRSSFSSSVNVIDRRFVYDHAGRLTNVYHALGDTVSIGTEVLLAKQTYNELGQLINKDLHSVGGSVFRQSVDYRYNIRGWLTSINDASLSDDGLVNSDGNVANDYFGLNLMYNTVVSGIGNRPLFNGNISSMTWSHNQGLDIVKSNAYVYSYDSLNRLKSAGFRERNATSWTSPSNRAFAETGLTYDLNGNILTLLRNDNRATGVMDSLRYDYGTGTLRSNRLLKVADHGDKTSGFVDGGNTGNDYVYDANGNMLRDMNKGVGISDLMTYNVLNLPQTVTKGDNIIRYVYDATGRKLAQQVGAAMGAKLTDYVGEFVYENDILQFVNHEEGRVVMAGTKLVYTNSFDTTDGVNAKDAVLDITTIDGETYLEATLTSTTKPGAFPIGNGIAVQGGEKYMIRVKGYRLKGTASATHAANILVQVDGQDLGWPGALLPAGSVTSTAESWIEQIVTIPPGGQLLKAGVVGNSTIVQGEILCLNEFQIIRLEDQLPEYQYFLKDHLGNVRLTFTTRDETEVAKATLEDAKADEEAGKFINYDEAVTVNRPVFDHTHFGNPAQTTFQSTRLAGGANNRFGLARSISVMPGDKVSAEVYGKYVSLDPNDPDAAAPSLAAFLASLSDGAASGTIIDGGQPGISGYFPLARFMVREKDTENGPKAYLNWLYFDRNFNFKNAGFTRLTTAAKETDSTGVHEKLRIDEDVIKITEAGYVYFYLSNEEEQFVDVFFDDFMVTQVKSAVIQSDDYYPFGLTFNSNRRENILNNRWRFQGQEHIDALDLGWDSFKWRNHQPAIGRFFNVDPLAEKYSYNSPYAFSENKVVNHIELEGLEAISSGFAWEVGAQLGLANTIQSGDRGVLEILNNSGEALSIINENKESIKESAERTGVSEQAVASIIFQEQTAGTRGDVVNFIGEIVKGDNPTLSLGLGEIQIGKAAELMGLDPGKLTKEQIAELKEILKDPVQNIELVALNVKDMQSHIGRPLTVQEATFGHNAGKEALKAVLDKGGVPENRVSRRSLGYQSQIKANLK